MGVDRAVEVLGNGGDQIFLDMGPERRAHVDLLAGDRDLHAFSKRLSAGRAGTPTAGLARPPCCAEPGACPHPLAPKRGGT